MVTDQFHMGVWVTGTPSITDGNRDEFRLGRELRHDALCYAGWAVLLTDGVVGAKLSEIKTAIAHSAFLVPAAEVCRPRSEILGYSVPEATVLLLSSLRTSRDPSCHGADCGVRGGSQLMKNYRHFGQAPNLIFKARFGCPIWSIWTRMWLSSRVASWALSAFAARMKRDCPWVLRVLQ